MGDVDDFNITIHLQRNKNLLVRHTCAREKEQKARAYGIADGEATPQVLVFRVQVWELGKPKKKRFPVSTQENGKL
jgi:hypothetical protein